MKFDLPPVRLVADFKASAMGIKPKSPGSVATVSQLKNFSGSKALSGSTTSPESASLSSTSGLPDDCYCLGSEMPRDVA